MGFELFSTYKLNALKDINIEPQLDRKALPFFVYFRNWLILIYSVQMIEICDISFINKLQTQVTKGHWRFQFHIYI